MSWMQTYTGLKATPLSLQPEQVRIEDIAHSLSLICRFNGHCKFHYSVARHSILVALHLPKPIRIHGLLHDAAEAYVGDAIRPLKPRLFFSRLEGDAPFEAIENSVLIALYQCLGVPWPDWAVWDQVKEQDNRAVMTEARDIMGNPPEDWGVPAKPWDDVKILPDPSPEYAEGMFLSMFNTYRQQ